MYITESMANQMNKLVKPAAERWTRYTYLSFHPWNWQWARNKGCVVQGLWPCTPSNHTGHIVLLILQKEFTDIAEYILHCFFFPQRWPTCTKRQMAFSGSKPPPSEKMFYKEQQKTKESVRCCCTLQARTLDTVLPHCKQHYGHRNSMGV